MGLSLLLVASIGLLALPARAGSELLDPRFGHGGRVATAGAPVLDTYPDGRIVVGSTTDSQPQRLKLARFLPNGERDRSFGRSGAVVTTLAPGENVTDVAVEPDGSVAVAAILGKPEGGAEIAILEFLPDGAPNPAFATDGAIILPDLPGDPLSVRLAVRPDGHVLVLAGYRREGTRLVRLDARGRLDRRFGSHGVLNVSPRLAFEEIALDHRGRILLGGAGVERRGPGFIIFTTVWAVERRLPSGRRDPSFGRNGIVRLRGRTFGAATDVTVDRVNRVVVSTGSTEEADSRPFTVVRLDIGGELDPEFGDGGVASVALPGRACTAEHVAIAPDGEIVLSGVSQRNSQAPHWMLAALHPVGSTDVQFGDAGLVDLGPIHPISLTSTEHGKPLFTGYNGREDFTGLYRLESAV